MGNRVAHIADQGINALARYEAATPVHRQESMSRFQAWVALDGQDYVSSAGLDLEQRIVLNFVALHILRVQVDEGLLRSEEPTSEIQSLIRISYAVLCLKNTTTTNSLPIFVLSIAFYYSTLT